MEACARCGHENPAEARFCNACGAPAAAAAAPRVEERKLVTVLFADLVGFTARVGAAGPRGRARDALALLRAAALRARAPRRHGREVHRRRGDGRVRRAGRPRGRPGARGAGGADDPRLGHRGAARAAGAHRRHHRRGARRARRPAERGRGHGGRRRGQHGGAAAGRRSRQRHPRRRAHLPRHASAPSSTARREPVRAKGKAEPIPVWEAVEARSRFGVDVVQTGAEHVGRERELALLRDALARATERAQRAARRPSSACPASARAGSCSSSPRSSTRRRSSSSGARAARCPTARASPTGRSGRWSRRRPGSSRRTRPRWSRPSCARRWPPSSARRARPLASRRICGRSSDSPAAGRRPAARHSRAWRRFFEALAEQGPLVLVFEDLHWADDGLLDFVDHLVDWATGVPLLVVCTARPELLERRPGLGRRQAQRADRLAVAAVGARDRRA